MQTDRLLLCTAYLELLPWIDSKKKLFWQNFCRILQIGNKIPQNRDENFLQSTTMVIAHSALMTRFFKTACCAAAVSLFLSARSKWICMNFKVRQILEIRRNLSKGVFTCSILASIVTILLSILATLMSIEPILEKCGHMQMQYSRVLSQYL